MFSIMCHFILNPIQSVIQTMEAPKHAPTGGQTRVPGCWWYVFGVPDTKRLLILRGAACLPGLRPAGCQQQLGATTRIHSNQEEISFFGRAR